MPRKEFQELVERCKVLVLKNGSYEQICVVEHYGLLVMDEDALVPDYVETAFCAAMADTLAEVYEDTLKWMNRTERGLIEDQIAAAVWLQIRNDAAGMTRR